MMVNDQLLVHQVEVIIMMVNDQLLVHQVEVIIMMVNDQLLVHQVEVNNHQHQVETVIIKVNNHHDHRRHHKVVRNVPYSDFKSDIRTLFFLSCKQLTNSSINQFSVFIFE